MKPSLIIAGLGNPGAQYDRTRHNVGFWAIDALSEYYAEGEWKQAPKFDALTQEARIITLPVLLVKPQTYMNRSGESLRKILNFYKLDPAKNLLVIVDDIDLPLGDTRFREKGGPGTHNGLKSIVEQFHEDFPRLRIGVGAPQNGEDLANWVLSAPPPAERELLEQACSGVPSAVRAFVLGDN